MPLREFIKEYQSQISLLGIQIIWTQKVTECLDRPKQADKNAEFIKKKGDIDKIMKELTAMCLEDIKTKLERTKIETLVTIHVHQVGVYGKILEEVKAGRIKAIGTTYLTRAPLAPEIPTIAEQGYPTFETDSWYGIVAPVSTSKAAIERMNQVINRTLQEPAVKKNLGDRGIEIIGGTPAKFKEHIQSEITKYERIVKSSNMQVD
jgi:hypothetical protein